MNKVTGIVTKVGDKYSGSVQLDNKTWYNNKKGFVNPVKVGDKVTLSLAEWSFDGKSGVNITAVDVVAVAQAEVKKDPAIEHAKSSARDFDKEARGKTRCALLQALYSNASLDTDDTDKLMRLADLGVDYVFGETE